MKKKTVEINLDRVLSSFAWLVVAISIFIQAINSYNQHKAIQKIEHQLVENRTLLYELSAWQYQLSSMIDEL